VFRKNNNSLKKSEYFGSIGASYFFIPISTHLKQIFGPYGPTVRHKVGLNMFISTKLRKEWYKAKTKLLSKRWRIFRLHTTVFSEFVSFFVPRNSFPHRKTWKKRKTVFYFSLRILLQILYIFIQFLEIENPKTDSLYCTWTCKVWEYCVSYFKI
jgi:hypothetical protein